MKNSLPDVDRASPVELRIAAQLPIVVGLCMIVLALLTTSSNVIRIVAAGYPPREAIFSLYGIGVAIYIVPAVLSIAISGAKWIQVVLFYVVAAFAAFESQPSLQPFLWLLCSVLLAWQYGYLRSRQGLRSMALIAGYFAMWGFNAVLMLVREPWSTFPISLGGLFVFFVVWSVLIMQTRIAVGRADELEEAVQRRTSELSQALREKDELVHELHHQTKSGLQMVSSMLQFEQDELTAASTSEALIQTQRRIHALGRLHDRVLSGTNHGRIMSDTFIREHLEDVLVVCDGRLRLSLNALPQGTISSEQALKIGIALNELLYGLVESVESSEPDSDRRSKSVVVCSLAQRGRALRVDVSVDGWLATEGMLAVGQRFRTAEAIARSTAEALSGEFARTVEGLSWSLVVPVDTAL